MVYTAVFALPQANRINEATNMRRSTETWQEYKARRLKEWHKGAQKYLKVKEARYRRANKDE